MIEGLRSQSLGGSQTTSILHAQAMGWGLVLRALGDSMAFSSHLIIEEAVIDLVLDRFDEALDETAEWLASG